jgi:hypothetical protein
MRKAPSRVQRPDKIRSPPMNSPRASAVSQNHAGRISDGASFVSVIHFARPGPPKVPNTFCAPCATKIIPRTNLRGIVDDIVDVDVRLFKTLFTFPSSSKESTQRFRVVIASNRHETDQLPPRLRRSRYDIFMKKIRSLRRSPGSSCPVNGLKPRRFRSSL